MGTQNCAGQIKIAIGFFFSSSAVAVEQREDRILFVVVVVVLDDDDAKNEPPSDEEEKKDEEGAVVKPSELCRNISGATTSWNSLIVALCGTCRGVAVALQSNGFVASFPDCFVAGALIVTSFMTFWVS